jgi:arabinose-5-phosphate isomerase
MLYKKKKLKRFITSLEAVPILRENNLLKEALEIMSKLQIGVCFCVNKDKKLIGILTDGDVRRKILSNQKPFSALLNDDLITHVNKKPKKIKLNQNLNSAINIMKKNKIWDLPVVDVKQKIIGMIHLHTIVQKLISK